jgi:GTPase Era involved in 16S rRNA processing
LVVVGLTGAGKSSTANTLAGRLHKAFAAASSVGSVTQAATFRDYSFYGEPFRVIDTPGLCDTARSGGVVRGELARIAEFAPHGVAAFVVVVPRGRFTAEHETALRELQGVFGDALLRLGVVAMTGATDSVADGRALLTRDAPPAAAVAADSSRQSSLTVLTPAPASIL